MKHVYSTLTADTAYTFGHGPDGQPSKVILVKGGHGVATKHFITPQGVVTSLEDEDADLLATHPLFQLHQKNGFVVIDSTKTDAEKVSASMEGRDKSAPLTPQDYELAGKQAPKVSKAA